MTRKQAPEPIKPIADETAIEVEEARLKALIKAEAGRQGFGCKSKAKRAKPLFDGDPRSQAVKFELTAREHDTDQGEESVEGVLQRLGKTKGS